MRDSSSLQSLQSWSDASQTLTREGVSLPTRARFSMDARRARADGRLEGEDWMRAVAWDNLVAVSSARSMRSSSSPPDAFPESVAIFLIFLELLMQIYFR